MTTRRKRLAFVLIVALALLSACGKSPTNPTGVTQQSGVAWTITNGTNVVAKGTTGIYNFVPTTPGSYHFEVRVTVPQISGHKTFVVTSSLGGEKFEDDVTSDGKFYLVIQGFNVHGPDTISVLVQDQSPGADKVTSDTNVKVMGEM